MVAIVTAAGSALSHSAILARSLHLPLVVGVPQALLQINDGDVLVVDGGAGRVVVEPDADDLRAPSHARARIHPRAQASCTACAASPRARSTASTSSCMPTPNRARTSPKRMRVGATGIGLYRTEFLFLQRKELPDEEEQFRAYRDVVLGMSGRPVTIRTLDLGADKADRTGLALRDEPNPALGLRGVRLSLRARPSARNPTARAGCAPPATARCACWCRW